MSLTFHEARNEMTIDLKAEIAKIVEKRKVEPNYYILVASQVNNFDPNVIDNKLILLKEEDKPKMPIIGTILYYVNNRQGKLERIWVLPRDIIQPESTINKAGDFSDEIFYHGEAPNR